MKTHPNLLQHGKVSAKANHISLEYSFSFKESIQKVDHLSSAAVAYINDYHAALKTNLNHFLGGHCYWNYLQKVFSQGPDSYFHASCMAWIE